MTLAARSDRDECPLDGCPGTLEHVETREWDHDPTQATKIVECPLDACPYWRASAIELTATLDAY